MSDVHLDMSEVVALTTLLGLKDAEATDKASEAVKDAAQTTRDLARRAAPVDTGALQRSIRMTGRGLTRRVRANAPYSAFVEFGATAAPQPFLYPASDKGEEMLAQKLVEIADSL